MSVQGGCYCKQVRFELQFPTEFCSHCHCEDCRRSHGAPFVTWVGLPVKQFKFLSGAEKIKEFESHPGIRWGFCSECGTSLLYDCDESAEKIYVTVSNLDGPLDREPEAHVSFEEQPTWLKNHEGLPRYLGKSEIPLEAHPVHAAAKMGFNQGADAYERGRPEYPLDAVNRLVSELDLSREKTVVELGAGTGKFTQLLSKSSRSKIIAVEPVEGMRKKFSEIHPEIEIIEGSAENIPLPTGSVDAVIAAQAFHWFDGEKTLKEIYRVLKPGGKIGLIWNARDESVGWVSQLTGIIDPYEMGAPRYKSGIWRQAFRATLLFSKLDSSEYRYIHSGTPQTIADRVASISFISALKPDEKAKVLGQVSELLASDFETQNKDQIDFPYRTDVFWCRKL